MKFKTILYSIFVFIAPVNFAMAQLGFDDNVDDIGPSAPIDDYIIPVLLAVLLLSLGLVIYNYFKSFKKLTQ